MHERRIFRATQDPNNSYVILNVSPLRDNRISWKAKGMLMYLHSQPDDIVAVKDVLIDMGPDGRASVGSGIAELVMYGYLQPLPMQGGELCVEQAKA